MHDPIAEELFRNAIVAIGDEMVLTIYRTAYSGVLKNIMDYSAAVCDAKGRLVAQGLSLPGHLCSIPVALGACLRHFGDDVADGDVLAVNDPYDGGMHLPDIFLFRPVFAAGRPIAWAATICHHTDVGGRVPGSNASDSTEIYAEGLRIPPLKLLERGRWNTTLVRMIERNVRVPVRVMGDLRAQLAACEIAIRGIGDLVARHGADGVITLMNATMDHSERLTRHCLAELPDGEATFTDWIDDDQIDAGKPIPLVCTVTKRGEHMRFDWTGSSPQVKGAINNTWSYTAAASFTAAKTILSVNMPNNDGVFRCIEVIAPPGTITNALPPAACAARGLTGFRCVDAAFGALALLYPGRVFAASDGGNVCVSLGGYRADRKPFIYVDFFTGAWGGRPWSDGPQGNANLCSNISSPSVEVTEVEQPLQILAYEFLPDAMGAGQYRGGAPFRRDYLMREKEGTIQVRNDRCAFRPFGLYGGSPGRIGCNVLNPGSNREKRLAGKVTLTIKCGDVFRYEMAGAGGWGDPLERDPARVLSDIRNEYVTAALAREQYGVIVDTQSWHVDYEKTAKLRRAMRGRRAWSKPPFIDRGELPPGAQTTK